MVSERFKKILKRAKDIEKVYEKVGDKITKKVVKFSKKKLKYKKGKTDRATLTLKERELYPIFNDPNRFFADKTKVRKVNSSLISSNPFKSHNPFVNDDWFYE